MLFNSFEFAIFLPIVVALYFTIPQRWRVGMLLAASCVFYIAFIPAYIFILLITILIDYTAGIYLERTVGRRRRMWLILSIVSTCIVLFVFKYFNFFTQTFTGLAQLAGWRVPAWPLNIILPIGLSFHTFQSLSYVVEVYQGRQKAEKDFIVYATYVMFFPQLVAGPIERPQNLLHQFREEHSFDEDRIVSGLRRMAWGFFKKLVVADRLALYVNDVFHNPQQCNGLKLSIAMLFFTCQIYCDFSGYTDIALGAARLMGFRLMENFRSPFHSRSVAEFWRRWHISLSTWFRDYLYFPMGGNRVPLRRWYLNILVTFGISGLWHGANWTYVVWGFLNGFYILIGFWTAGLREGIYTRLGISPGGLIRAGVGVASTFVLTCAAFTVFRARNLLDAFYVLSHCFRNWNWHDIATENFLSRYFLWAGLGILAFELVDSFGERVRAWLAPARSALVIRWAAYVALVMVVILFGVYRHSQFIYFQF